jgi:hypothetical protein
VIIDVFLAGFVPLDRAGHGTITAAEEAASAAAEANTFRLRHGVPGPSEPIVPGFRAPEVSPDGSGVTERGCRGSGYDPALP